MQKSFGPSRGSPQSSAGDEIGQWGGAGTLVQATSATAEVASPAIAWRLRMLPSAARPVPRRMRATRHAFCDLSRMASSVWPHRDGDVLWLVRHGSRVDFVDPFWGKTAARPHDPGLSIEGVEQARRVAKRLRSEGIRRIFTSPFLRCAQTAQLVAGQLGAPVHVEPGLGELNNPDWFDGLPELLSLSELSATTAAFDESHEPLHERSYPETIEQAFERATHTALGILDRYPGPTLLVGHAVSVMGIVRGLTGFDGDVFCQVASLFRIERIERQWKLTLNGDTSHLDEPVAGDRHR
jgi:broad specificity phosphatase PhoE